MNLGPIPPSMPTLTSYTCKGPVSNKNIFWGSKWTRIREHSSKLLIWTHIPPYANLKWVIGTKGILLSLSSFLSPVTVPAASYVLSQVCWTMNGRVPSTESKPLWAWIWSMTALSSYTIPIHYSELLSPNTDWEGMKQRCLQSNLNARFSFLYSCLTL